MNEVGMTSQSIRRRLPHEALYGYCWCSPSSSGISSLQFLCADLLVQDYSILRKVVKATPVTLMYLLLSTAIKKGRDRAAEILLRFWPSSVLILPSFLDNQCSVMHHFVQIPPVITVIRHFIDSATSGKPMNLLRVLDVSGYQLEQDLIEYILKKTASVPMKRSSGYILRCDVLIKEKTSFQQFCTVLEFSRSKKTVQIEVCNIEVEGIGESKLSHLLSLIDPSHVMGLSIAYNSLQCEGLTNIFPTLKRYNRVSTLDISCNLLRGKDQQHIEILGELFSQMSCLTKLCMKSCKITSHFRTIISKETISCSNFTHLNLSACELKRQDISVLSTFPNLQELILSENKLSGCALELVNVLGNLKDKLWVLQLSSCSLTSIEFEVFCPCFKHMEVLRMLDLSWNNFTEEDLTVMAEEFHVPYLPNLRKLFVPFPSNPTPLFFELIKKFEAHNLGLMVQTDLI